MESLSEELPTLSDIRSGRKHFMVGDLHPKEEDKRETTVLTGAVSLYKTMLETEDDTKRVKAARELLGLGYRHTVKGIKAVQGTKSEVYVYLKRAGEKYGLELMARSGTPEQRARLLKCYAEEEAAVYRSPVIMMKSIWSDIKRTFSEEGLEGR